MEQLNLFDDIELRPQVAVRTSFRIAEIEALDARGRSDHFNTLRELILANENMYPGIEKWFSQKVVPGLVTSQRIGYVAYVGERPVGSAILKFGARAKFCHLKIHKDFQDIDLGQLFFTIMTLELRNKATEIHFTLPESLWQEKRTFFKSFAFSNAVIANRQYRKGEEEFACSAPISDVLSASIGKLSKLVSSFSVGGFSLDNQLLMSIRAKYVKMILAGTKSIEIREDFQPAGWVVELHSMRVNRRARLSEKQEFVQYRGTRQDSFGINSDLGLAAQMLNMKNMCLQMK